MSLFAQITQAASQAQGTLAEMMGAAPRAPNFTLAGSGYIGVVTETQVESPGTSGGIEIVRELQIVATRDQFELKPDPAKRLPLVALNANWTLTNVGEGAAHYFLTARPA